MNTINGTLLNQDQYQYGIYEEYLNNVFKNLFFSEKKSLSIKMYKLNLDVSNHYESETSIGDSKMKNKNKYDIYNFIPTIESNSLSYNTSNQLDKGGYKISTSGTITIIVLENPVPGDLFQYYNTEDEVFKITGVNFVRNTHNKLKIYQLTYETANLKISSLEELIIHKEYFWITEFEFFFESHEWDNYVNILQFKEEYLNRLSEWYNSVKCLYEHHDNNDQQNYKLNNILKFLNNIIPSFGLKYIDWSVELNQYNIVDNFTDSECYIPKEEPVLLPPDKDDPTDMAYVYDAHLQDNEITPNLLTKKLFDWYSQLINHKLQRKDEISWNQQ